METISQKSRLAVVLFALFFGPIGFHRFYVGKIGTGIVQLVLSLTIFGLFISIPWSIIDLIMAIAGSFRDKENRVVEKW